MTEPSDEALIGRIAEADGNAFGVFLRRHLDALVRFVARYTDNVADAEDIAQETFTRVWLHAGGWESRGASPRSWLYRIAYNLSMDNLRKRRPSNDAELINLPAPGTVDPARQALNDVEADTLQRALRTIPERQYTALTLCVWHGLSNQEAAECMAISVEALESLLARARRALRKRLLVEDAELVQYR